MRQFILTLLLPVLLALSAVHAQSTLVTFHVDMSEFQGSFETVNLNGDFNSWCGTCIEMHDDDGDGVYSTTVDIEQATVEYLFTTNGWDGVQESFSSGEPCTLTTGIYTNRYAAVEGEIQDLGVVCFNSCSSCESTNSGENTSMVTFLVDMNQESVVSAAGVHLAGDFQGWDPSASPLSDADGDGVWETTILLEQGEYVFKFINGDSWLDGVENLNGACSDGQGNRMLTVGSESLTSLACFNSCEASCPLSTPPTLVTFEVDMAQEDSIFSAGVHIAGDFQGWDPSASPLSDADGDGVWEITLLLDQGDHSFKFINGDSWEGVEDYPNQGCADDWGNRLLTVGDEPMDYGACFGSCEACPLLGCLDILACNYELDATEDDGSCSYPGCMDPLALNYDSTAGCSDQCVYLTFDCVSIGNEAWSNEPMGLFPEWQEALHGVAWEGEWVLNIPPTMIEPASGVSYGVHHVDWLGMEGIPDWATITSFEEGEALDASTQYCIAANGTPTAPEIHAITATGEVFISVFGQPFSIGEQVFSATLEVVANPNPIPGCTYALANNYVPYATEDDGNCEYWGCTDPTSANYNPYANVDDGSCGVPCGASATNCQADTDGDGVVAVSDLLILLGEFGLDCE